MADILSPAELDAIRGRCEAATGDAWAIVGEADLLDGIDDLMIVASQIGPPLSDDATEDDDLYIANIGPDFAPLGVYDATPQNLANAKFIAHARADIPRLLAHVAALDALLSTAARELELSCYTDEAATYQANKQRRLDLAARIRAALGHSTDAATATGAAAGEAT